MRSKPFLFPVFSPEIGLLCGAPHPRSRQEPTPTTKARICAAHSITSEPPPSAFPAKVADRADVSHSARTPTKRFLSPSAAPSWLRSDRQKTFFNISEISRIGVQKGYCDVVTAWKAKDKAQFAALRFRLISFDQLCDVILGCWATGGAKAAGRRTTDVGGQRARFVEEVEAGGFCPLGGARAAGGIGTHARAAEELGA